MPPEYAELLGITTLVCTPLSAAGRAYGVICADRGGGRFELSDGERHLLWTLGKTAALVATARNATRQQERARRLGERLDLAREIHERVHAAAVRRVAGAERRAAARPRPSASAAGSRCRRRSADLRRALERPLAPLPPETGTTLAAELERLAGTARSCRSTVHWPDGRDGAGRPRAARAVGAGRGAAQRRQARQRRRGSTSPCPRDDDTFALEVRNDGARRGARGAGMGLRLAAFEALQHGGVVEFGPTGEGGWRVRLVVPLPEQEAVANGGSEARREDRRLRVLVVDDHDVVHWGFRVLLGEQPWVERCLAARTGAEALELTQTLRAARGARRPVPRPGSPGADLCESIRAASPSTRVLLISGAGRMSPAAARAAGASGFVSKDWEAHDVAMAVRMVGLGMTMFPPKSEQPAPLLSEREREVLDLIAAGSTNREIAAAPVSCRRTRSRSTRARCTASSRRATAPRRCSGRSGSACWRRHFLDGSGQPLAAATADLKSAD